MDALEFKNELVRRLNNVPRYTHASYKGIQYYEVETIGTDDLYRIINDILNDIPEEGFTRKNTQ